MNTYGRGHLVALRTPPGRLMKEHVQEFSVDINSGIPDVLYKIVGKRLTKGGLIEDTILVKKFASALENLPAKKVAMKKPPMKPAAPMRTPMEKPAANKKPPMKATAPMKTTMKKPAASKKPPMKAATIKPTMKQMKSMKQPTSMRALAMKRLF